MRPRQMIACANKTTKYEPVHFVLGIILGMGFVNERMRYYLIPSVIEWDHAQNDLCVCPSNQRVLLGAYRGRVS